MAALTPQHRSLARNRSSQLQSSINTASSPNLGASFNSQRPGYASSRKVSLGPSNAGGLSTIVDGEGGASPNSQEAGSSPFTMNPAPTRTRTVVGDRFGNNEIGVGDMVDVPGGMHGTVKFIGEVRGKQGTFAGVELDREWAARGKNDGNVDGYVALNGSQTRMLMYDRVQYFTTSIPGAGIFLPSSKAYKRLSQPIFSDSSPPTPTTPSLAAFNVGGRGNKITGTPPTPAVSKLGKSVGPGRAASPALKPRSRPSLPRPESPLRRTQNPTSTPVAKASVAPPNFSKSTITPSRNAPSPAPAKFGGSVRGFRQVPGGDPAKRPGKFQSTTSKGINPNRSPSRSQSRLGPDSRFDEEPNEEPFVSNIGSKRTSLGYNPRRGNEDTDEIRNLKNQLAERDKQLKDQALSLAEMENNVSELHSTMTIQQPPQRPRGISRHPSIDDADVSTLREVVREKNEKIALLTAEFDGHRADFRSTIDTLEMASSETERVYEQRVQELTQENRELQAQNEDVESVAQQLKQLEDLVQELEEGLEDARRGEAEARGEVEFLRGEVERGRSELRREKDIAAAALEEAKANVENSAKSQRMSRDLEQRDDEIRGLKAIIHSLSRGDGGGDRSSDAMSTSSPKLGSRRVSRQRQSGLGGGGREPGQSNGVSISEEQVAEQREARQNLERQVKELEDMVDAKTHREDELERQLKRLTQDLTPVSPVNGHAPQPSNSARPGTSGSSSHNRIS